MNVRTATAFLVAATTTRGFLEVAKKEKARDWSGKQASRAEKEKGEIVKMKRLKELCEL